MTDFSLNLNEDQLQIQKWTHDFAENVIRPAAHEWDEREEFPWPVVQEAAKTCSLALMRGRLPKVTMISQNSQVKGQPREICILPNM